MTNIDYLDKANEYADNNSTCLKTHVGCCLTYEDSIVAYGSNSNIYEDCRKLGCLRKSLFGNNSKEHRMNCRCYKNHSEIDALNKCKGKKIDTAYVTRYPCFPCALALVNAGVKTIVYGREFEIEPNTKEFLSIMEINVIHISDWNCDENDKNV